MDCRFGTNGDLAAFVRLCHESGLRVVLDAFSTTWAAASGPSRTSGAEMGFAVQDWFNINFDGDSPYGDGFWYEGWEGHYELVKLNLRNGAVVDYLLETVRLLGRGVPA